MGRPLLLAAMLALLVAAGDAPAQTAAPAPDCVRSVAGLDLQRATIPDLEAAMAAGRLTSAQLVDAYLARIAAYDGQLDAIRDLDPRAREQASALDAERAAGKLRGPLHGIPVLLKDNVATTDEPTTAGSISLAGVVPVRDAAIARRLRDAGAVILGKTNLSEFAGWVDLNAPPGWSSLGGQVHNAYAPGLSPSGSSAGSGVAASMAFAAATIGTETSGSILSPSDASGDVGIKTTLGIASRAGILPLAPSYDVPGPIVRSVTDAAVILGAIAGADPADAATAAAQLPPGGDFTASLKPGALKGITLAYGQDAHDSLDAQRMALFDAGLERLAKLGATVKAVSSFDSENVGLSEIGAIPNEFKASLNAYLADEMPSAPVKSLADVVAKAQANPDKYPYGINLLQASDAMPGSSAGYPLSEDGVRTAARASIDGALTEAGADAIVTPGPAHANIGAAAGYPTVMVPLGYVRGTVPMGMGFLGQAYAEPRLIGYAYDYEQAAAGRVAPTDVNPQLQPKVCPAAAAPATAAPGAAASPIAPATALAPLRVTAVRHGRRVVVTVRGALGSRLRVILRRGRAVVARRGAAVRGGRGRVILRLRGRGAYRVVVLDPGPPLRTVAVRVRQGRG